MTTFLQQTRYFSLPVAYPFVHPHEELLRGLRYRDVVAPGRKMHPLEVGLSESREVRVSLQIDIDAEALAEFCRHNGIRRLSFFGSVLREDFGPDSDVDVLVEFIPDSGVGLFEFVGLQRELGGLLGRDVDLHTPASLSHFFRAEVIDSAEVAYAA